MAIKTGQYLNLKDVYIDYTFEEVMFRREHVEGEIYRKFYGENEYTVPITCGNRLFSDALLSGTEISREEYLIGKLDSNEHS